MLTKIFKHFFLLFFTTISLVALSSCDWNPDPDPSPDPDKTDSSIVGRWVLTHSSGWEKENGKIVDRWDMDEDELDEDIIFNFKKNGELVIMYDGDKEYGEWEISGKKLYLYEDDDDEATAWDIKTLTSSRLVISAREKDDPYEYYDEMTFRKD